MAISTPHWVAVTMFFSPVTQRAHTPWQRDRPLLLEPGLWLLTACGMKPQLWLEPENLLWT